MLNSAHDGGHRLCTVSAAVNSALFDLIGKKYVFFLHTLFLPYPSCQKLSQT